MGLNYGSDVLTANIPDAVMQGGDVRGVGYSA